MAELIPNCGEDCASRKFTLNIFWPTFTSLLFVGASWYWSRGGTHGFKYWLIRTWNLFALTFIISGGVYIYNLQDANRYLYSIREIQPSSDFSRGVIARLKTPVFIVNEKGRVEFSYTISQWERCFLGNVEMAETPPRIEIECRSGVGWIEKDQEKNFIVIPEK